MDEVHCLIEKFGRKILFILTGSSARKFKKASANMLAGRVWQFFLFPFTHIEVGKKFNLEDALTKGTLFEQFVIQETCRLIHSAEKPYRLYHWRSSHGAEVDMIIETQNRLWAIEIKSSPTVSSGNLTGLKSFMKGYSEARPLCVSTCGKPFFAGE